MRWRTQAPHLDYFLTNYSIQLRLGFIGFVYFTLTTVSLCTLWSGNYMHHKDADVSAAVPRFGRRVRKPDSALAMLFGGDYKIEPSKSTKSNSTKSSSKKASNWKIENVSDEKFKQEARTSLKI